MCQYWRESIISAQENWTLISGCGIGLAALTLERSKLAPLHLRLDSSLSSRSMFRKTIIPYVQKIEVLQFEELRKFEDLILVLPNFPQSTSNLRSLKLAAHDDNTRG